jgi:hypothetical protein
MRILPILLTIFGLSFAPEAQWNWRTFAEALAPAQCPKALREASERAVHDLILHRLPQIA